MYRSEILVRLIPDAQGVARLLHHQRALDALEWQRLVQAVRHLHEEQVFHPDLNCHNLMLDSAGKAWIVNFEKCGYRAEEDCKAYNLRRLLRSLRKELGLNPQLYWDESQWIFSWMATPHPMSDTDSPSKYKNSGDGIGEPMRLGGRLRSCHPKRAAPVSPSLPRQGAHPASLAAIGVCTRYSHPACQPRSLDQDGAALCAAA